ncbi:MAG TPA: phosphoglycerate kinase [Candidatus Paceibacterota bacterium]|nr:phosphoglycerate kinase [Candidatus Paceibacterota bacterium]
MTLKSVDKITRLKGKRVLLRIDLNVPIENGMVEDDYRIKRSLKTIEFLRKEGAKVIIISHRESLDDNSLSIFSKYFDIPFIDMHAALFSDKSLSFMKNGDAVLLENLRMDPGEKKNSPIFAKKLASLADVFVNEAFSVSHRAHASIVGVPKLLPTYFGFLFLDEVKNLSTAFSPEHPFVFILGGAKFETKLPLIRKFLGIADKVFVGGALANTFLREKGFEIGKSKAEGSMFIPKDVLNNEKVVIPKDFVVKGEYCRCIKKADEIETGDVISDIGPSFIDEVDKAVLSAKFVLWNGPLGMAESGFGEGTRSIAKTIAISDARSILGGGDTVAAIKELGTQDNFTFVSTGGGAMLEFLASGSLPGIDIVAKQN